MENPWRRLPERDPYVLPEDRHLVERHNARISTRENADQQRLYTDLLPDPYGGDPEAPVILLLKQTGFSTEDYRAQQDATFREATIRNLMHMHLDWPLYSLDPRFSWTAAAEWWRRLTGPVREHVDDAAVAQRVFYAQLSPYHSPGQTVAVPSIEYTRHLVEQGMMRGALILILLSWKKWFEIVPGLESYANCYWPPGQRRQALLTEGSIGQEAFRLLRHRLTE